MTVDGEKEGKPRPLLFNFASSNKSGPVGMIRSKVRSTFLFPPYFDDGPQAFLQLSFVGGELIRFLVEFCLMRGWRVPELSERRLSRLGETRIVLMKRESWLSR